MVVLTVARADKTGSDRKSGSNTRTDSSSKNAQDSILERRNSRSALLRHIRSLSNTFEIWCELLFGILDAFDQEELVFLTEERQVTLRRHALTLSEAELGNRFN